MGAKVGLAILSALSPLQLAQAVSAQDKNSFTRANGVGPKLAARIVTELKDKIVMAPLTAAKAELAKEAGMDANQETTAYTDALVSLNSEAGDSQKMEDAISALVNLGYQRLEAYKAVNQAALGNPEADMSTLIKLALKEFAKKD